jgi:hypothetical protein
VLVQHILPLVNYWNEAAHRQEVALSLLDITKVIAASENGQLIQTTEILQHVIPAIFIVTTGLDANEQQTDFVCKATCKVQSTTNRIHLIKLGHRSVGNCY